MKRLEERHDMNGGIERAWPMVGLDRLQQGRSSLAPLAVKQEGAGRAGALEEPAAPLEELNEALEKANRRIHRLQGEKNQLSTLLDKRDEQIQRLNRELGQRLPAHSKATRNKAKASPEPSASVLSLASFADRIRAFFVRASEATADAAANHRFVETSPSEYSPLIARQKGIPVQRVVAVLLFGLVKEDIERLLPSIARDCSSRGMTPLYLIDIDAFEVLRSDGQLFEYLPPADDRDRFDRSLHWDLYVQRRLALIRRKWDPVRVVAFGASATTTLSLWSSSPFEERPLPAGTGEIAAS